MSLAAPADVKSPPLPGVRQIPHAPPISYVKTKNLLTQNRPIQMPSDAFSGATNYRVFRIFPRRLRSSESAESRRVRSHPGKKYDNTPEDELRHDVTDELAAYKLAQLPFPGVFGVFYQSDRPTKNALEKQWVDSTREKLGQPTDLALLQKTFNRMK